MIATSERLPADLVALDALQLVSPQTNTKVQWTLSLNWRMLAVVLGTAPLVSVVDDDESVRESLPDLLKEFGCAVRTFSSSEDFLASDCVEHTKCLILDIAMPGMSGPELHHELKLRRQKIPIVFITASRDESIRAQMLEQGAVECLFKPFSDTALFEALQAALKVR